MNSATAFLTCLLVLCAQGQPASRSNKCKCYSYIGRISPKLITAEPIIYHPSVFCPRTEIIVTIKADTKKCVNPESPLGRLILKNQNKHGKNGAVSTTTAGQSTAGQSTAGHSTAGHSTAGHSTAGHRTASS